MAQNLTFSEFSDKFFPKIVDYKISDVDGTHNKMIYFQDKSGKGYSCLVQWDPNTSKVHPPKQPPRLYNDFILYINRTKPESYNQVEKIISGCFLPAIVKIGQVMTTYIIENWDRSEIGAVQFWENSEDVQKWQFDQDRLKYTQVLLDYQRKPLKMVSNHLIKIVEVSQNNTHQPVQPGNYLNLNIERYKPEFYRNARNLVLAELPEIAADSGQNIKILFFENPEVSEFGFLQIFSNPLDIEKFNLNVDKIQLSETLQPMKEKPSLTYRFKITQILKTP